MINNVRKQTLLVLSTSYLHPTLGTRPLSHWLLHFLLKNPQVELSRSTVHLQLQFRMYMYVQPQFQKRWDAVELYEKSTKYSRDKIFNFQSDELNKLFVTNDNTSQMSLT